MLTARLALITGGSMGLGLALAHALAKRGIPLILVSRSEERLKKAALDLPSSTQIHAADLSHPGDCEELIKLIKKRQPDLIINNAGFGLYGPALSHAVSDQIEMVEVNAKALMQITLEGAKTLISEKKKGTILNISSAAGFFSYPGHSVYAATKAFVNSFSESFDREVHKQGVRVLTVCPGLIDTEFRRRASRNYSLKKNSFTMSASDAAEMILKKAEKGTALSIIDWRYRFAVFLSSLLPKRLTQAILEKRLQPRQGFNLRNRK
ncbi:MAG: SDR family NAD(P)-dependent oxidoreductase [Verrucomicrobia bacterium]|nr:SDR family NAD(P)-dependent oxidoreductase [Verrucomicrobiota bacterium]